MASVGKWTNSTHVKHMINIFIIKSGIFKLVFKLYKNNYRYCQYIFYDI